MANTSLATLRSKVYSAIAISVFDSRLPVATVNGHINDALQEVASWTPFPDLTEYATFSTVADTVEYILAAGNIASVTQVRWANTALKRIPYEEALWVRAGEGSGAPPAVKGAPSQYSFVSGRLYLVPIPDKVYTISYIYTRWPDALTLDADTCDLDSVYDRVIIKVAALSCLETLNDMERYGAFERSVARLKSELLNTVNKNTTPIRARGRKDWNG